MSSGVSIEGERESGKDVRSTNGNPPILYSPRSHVCRQHCAILTRASGSR